MFWFKKFLTFWVMPTTLVLALSVSGLALLLSGRRPRLARGLLAAGILLFGLLANKTVSNSLLGPLESQFQPIPELQPGAPLPEGLSGCGLIVVLGGGNNENPGVAALGRLSTSSLGRLTEAVRLLRLMPQAQLVVSGPGDPGHPTHASILTRAAQSLGVDRSRITLIEIARDTEEESREVARVAKGRRVALVTSAWHMPRAALLFRRAGIDFVACPADFSAHARARFHWVDLLWDTESFERSTRAIHEWTGILWLRIRG